MKTPLALLYHAVAPLPGHASPEERQLFVDPGDFERQMNHLARAGFHSLRLDEYAAALGGDRSPRSVLLTFDDAYAHVDETVTPVLLRNGFTAVMFSNWSHLGGLNSWDHAHANLSRLAIATSGRLRAMADGPWEIASHGLRHVDLRRVPSPQRIGELIVARKALSELIDAPVVDFAYPYGYDDPDVRRDVARAGYRMAFLAAYTPGRDPLRLARRPISGMDSLATFRLKTASWSNALYRARNLTPSWASAAARGLLQGSRH